MTEKAWPPSEILNKIANVIKPLLSKYFLILSLTSFYLHMIDKYHHI